jgi:TorA maturation chaperone TorD
VQDESKINAKKGIKRTDLFRGILIKNFMMERFKTYKFFAHLLSYPYDQKVFFENLERFYPFKDRKPLNGLREIPFGELQAEYTSIFEVKPGGAPCKPYQSVFEGEGQLMGNATIETERYYDLFGLDTGSEFADRANLQLDFAAFLINAKEQTPYAEDKKKLDILFRDFFKKHILWMEKLADCITKNSSIEPLKELMGLFKEFLQKEKKLLGL